MRRTNLHYELNYDACANEIVRRSQSSYDWMLRTKTFYNLTLCGVFSFCLYSFIEYPFITTIFIFISYFAYQSGFMVYHSSLHAQFVEVDHRQLLTGPFIAFVHHYVNPKLLCCWEHRATYQSSVIVLTLSVIFSVCFLLAGKIMMPFVSTFLLWHLTSSPIHEWYHMPPKLRREKINRIEYHMLIFFEKIKLISTKKHANHHRHQINSKHDVIEFDDAYVGKYLSKIFDALWQFAFKYIYKEHKKYLTVFYSLLYVLMVSGLAVLAFGITKIILLI